MFDEIITLFMNLFRVFVIKKFMAVFFETDGQDKGKKNIIAYVLFFSLTSLIHLVFQNLLINIVANILMLYFIAKLYEGEKKKKILVTFLIYGINMICDILSVYSLSNYNIGEEYSHIAPCVTVLMICICELIIERLVIKNKRETFTPPCWNILVSIPIISMGILFVLIMNNINNRGILVLVSIGILLINMLIFNLYNALMDTYMKIEENALFERQIASYSNQLDVLMQSEEKLSALSHDMKHHLNELLSIADKHSNQEITSYINNMQMFMNNKFEYVRSGNKDIDSVLNYMINKADQILKNVEYKVNIPKESTISSFDLNVIFGNLLDNAILAASNSKEKWLSVYLTYNKGIIFINIKNTFSNKIVKKDSSFITTKHNMECHGIGLQNVKKIVKNYQGTIDISNDKHIFNVKILLYTSEIKE